MHKAYNLLRVQQSNRVGPIMNKLTLSLSKGFSILRWRVNRVMKPYM